MKKFLLIAFVFALLCSCDDRRIYDTNHDFDDRRWLVNDKPEFEFEIADNSLSYDVDCNIRNAVSYPYSRLFINYELLESTGASIQKKLISTYLFDQKTGEPFGDSGLGDIYDQRVPLLKAYHFPKPGKYKIRLEQYMRTDTLNGILAVGVRLQRADSPPPSEKK